MWMNRSRAAAGRIPRGGSVLDIRDRGTSPRAAARAFEHLEVPSEGAHLAVDNSAVLSSVMPLVAVSGADCIDALVQSGFVVRSTDGGKTTLAREGRVVCVPRVSILSPDELHAMLDAARLDYGTFLDLLSEMPTNPDQRILSVV